MRIIAGSLRGREFKSPQGHRTHPMSDKVRGALFNTLGDIEDLTFLDAFAGSGALAFEAVSRGAASVAAIEKDRNAHDIIDQNVAALSLGSKVKVIRANVSGWSLHNQEEMFDIVLLDPPYEQLQTSTLEMLVKWHIKSGGLAVLSWPGKSIVPNFDHTEVVANKDYGDAQLVFYRKQ